MRRSIIARTSGRVKPGRPGWLSFLVAALVLLLSVTALAGTPGKAYNLSLDTGTLDNRPVYAFSSLPATFKLRARVLDQTGSPVTGLTGSQLVIQGGKNCRSGTALNAGTDYTTGAFAEVGNGLFEWTVTLNPGGLSSGDIGQFEVRVTGSPATDNQWLAATVFVKHGTMANGDVHYVEVQPAANYGAGNLKTGNPDYPFTVRFFDGNGNPLYLGEVNNTTTPSGEIYLSLFNWTQSGGVATPSGYGVNGYHNYSGTYDYHFFLLGNASYFYGLTEGLSQYVTVAARKGNFEFLIPMGLTALVNTGTGSSTAVPTFTYPSLFPATMIGNWDYTYTAYTIPPGENTLIAYETDERDPGADFLLRLLELFPDINPTWLLTGDGEMQRTDAVIRNGQEVLIVEAKGQTRPAQIDPTRNIQVKVYAMAGAGNACELEELEPVDEVVIPLEFHRMSIIPVKVRGRSMETTIMDGAIVGIDSAETWVTSGDLYAVWLPYEGAVVKRIYMDADKVVCKSDNPAFSDIVVPLKQMSEHFVRGKVRWVIQQF